MNELEKLAEETAAHFACDANGKADPYYKTRILSALQKVRSMTMTEASEVANRHSCDAQTSYEESGSAFDNGRATAAGSISCDLKVMASQLRRMAKGNT